MASDPEVYYVFEENEVWKAWRDGQVRMICASEDTMRRTLGYKAKDEGRQMVRGQRASTAS